MAWCLAKHRDNFTFNITGEQKLELYGEKTVTEDILKTEASSLRVKHRSTNQKLAYV
jgi:hypothetical protein